MENWNIEEISLDAYAHKDVLSENLGWIFRLSGDKLKIVGRLCEIMQGFVVREE